MARRVFVVSTILAVASGVLTAVLYGEFGSNRVYYGTDTRAAAILLGAALAALLAWRGPARSGWLRVAVEVTGLAGAVGLAVMWASVDGASPWLYQGGLFGCSLAAVAVIAAAGHPRSGALARVLRLRPLVLLGLVSYGVYLWHWPVFVWLDAARARLTGWSLFGVQVATTLTIAVASFVLLERPVRRGALRAAQLRVLVPAIAVGLVVALTISTAGYRSPKPVAARDHSVSHVLAAARTDLARPVAFRPLRLLVVGNSVPFLLAREGFEQLHTQPPLLVLNGALPACTFPDATEVHADWHGWYSGHGDPCSTGWDDEVRAFRPDTVLLTIADILGDYRHDGRWLRPCTPAFDDWFAATLLWETDVLTRYGARLVIATSAYSTFVGVPRDRLRQTDCVNDLERAAAARDPRISIIDLARYICPTRETCRDYVDGVPIRPDGVHYRGQSAAWVASWMLPQLGFHDAGGKPIVAAPLEVVAAIEPVVAGMGR